MMMCGRSCDDLELEEELPLPLLDPDTLPLLLSEPEPETELDSEPALEPEAADDTPLDATMLEPGRALDSEPVLGTAEPDRAGAGLLLALLGMAAEEPATGTPADADEGTTLPPMAEVEGAGDDDEATAPEAGRVDVVADSGTLPETTATELTCSTRAGLNSPFMGFSSTTTATAGGIKGFKSASNRSIGSTAYVQPFGASQFLMI